MQRLKRLISALTPIILIGCSGPAFNDRERDEISDIAGDVSADPDEVEALKSRVADLEQRLDDAGIGQTGM